MLLRAFARTASAINSPFHPSLGRVCENFATLQKPLSQFATSNRPIPAFGNSARRLGVGVSSGWKGGGGVWGAPRRPGARVPVKGQPGGECGNVCLAREQSLFVRSAVRPLLLLLWEGNRSESDAAIGRAPGQWASSRRLVVATRLEFAARSPFRRSMRSGSAAFSLSTFRAQSPGGIGKIYAFLGDNFGVRLEDGSFLAVCERFSWVIYWLGPGLFGFYCCLGLQDRISESAFAGCTLQMW